MSATAAIYAKWQELKSKGLDLGAKVGAEADAGYGGRVQIYERGRIYWHTNTGAHEVHGGILTKYLAGGGPGVNPQTGRRHFGFPVTDEERTADGLFPISRFEFGEIDFVSGSGGGVSIFGDFYTEWKRLGKEIGRLQHPITEPVSVAGGQAVYFERGVMWQGSASDGKVITCAIDLPQLGRPRLINPDDQYERRFPRLATWSNLSTPVANAILARDRALFQKLWENRLVARRVNKPGTQVEQIVLRAEPTEVGSQSSLFTNVYVTLVLPNDAPTPLRDRALYNIGLRLPNGNIFVLAPHSLYIKRSWANFGVIHATDIHVSRRLEAFRGKLRAAATKNSQLAAGVQEYNNFNDSFRDLIRYANRLHDLGMLDAILATGDLVDYAFEEGERKSYNGGNFAFFERMVRGQVPSPDGVPSEELRVPIYTTMGNHDYRVNPYHLLCTVDVPGPWNKTVREYSTHNVTEPEAAAIQGGHPWIDPDEALKMILVDTGNWRKEYEYYLRRINNKGSYLVPFGAHRVVMLDTREDAGLPTSADWGTILNILVGEITGTLNPNLRQAHKGSAPNSLGVRTSDINLVRQALGEAGSNGVVIVGMHAPAISVRRREFAHYFRQTERPSADRRELYGYLLRLMTVVELEVLLRAVFGTATITQAQKLHDYVNGLSSEPYSADSWRRITTYLDENGGAREFTQAGVSHFKAGSVDRMLNDGIALDATGSFLKYCAGVDAARSVDIVLAGHHHDRVEYRLRWDAARQQLRYYTDFYTENPDVYYPSVRVGVKDPVHLRVRAGAPFNGQPTLVRDHRHSPVLEYAQLDVPPYDNPLDKAGDPRTWWQSHRPLLLETASLGPIDYSHRAAGNPRPHATFQGFRLIAVDNNVISKIRYVTLQELRRNNFRMPWEIAAVSTPAEPAEPMTLAAPQPEAEPAPVMA